MSTRRIHSPVRRGARESRTATEAIEDLRRRKLVVELPGGAFSLTYLTGVASRQSWTAKQQVLVNRIQKWKNPRIEPLLYTGSAPLLRLLNSISLQIVSSQKASTSTTLVLVFRTRHRIPIPHPFNKNSQSPDIVAEWDTREILRKLASEYVSGTSSKAKTVRIGSGDADDFDSSSKLWSDLVAVGEVKLQDNSSYQLANYLQNLLQLHPEQNAVLGLSVKPSGYRLFYHDASLYKRDFRDHSMAVLDRAYAVNIESHRFISLGVRPEPGPGQRRFIVIMHDIHKKSRRFQKDSWRGFCRRFFEGLMYAKAHDGAHIPGLMTILFYGYVLDSNRKRLETTVLHPEVGQRAKMRLISEDVGQPLKEVKSLSQFLCVMYDACVVQRNLYRKCKILHRDISDSNIMVAPTDLEFKKHCDGKCYDGVKYLNQILAKDINVKPEPACLVVDLGNGADLSQLDDNAEALAERTIRNIVRSGTPKFIARSVSRGKLLPGEGYPTNQKAMPILEGRALELYKFSNEAEYTKYTEAVQERAHVDISSQVKHKHQLFHDAESTFWVTAWTLACSAPRDYIREEAWPEELDWFVSVMETHQPGPKADSRDVCAQGLDEWTVVLHPSLASVAGMVSQMHSYVHPEWQHRPELDVEHVHKALMRLLLTEIVRIEDSGADVELFVGGRALPTASDSRPLQRNTHSSSMQQLTTMMLNTHLQMPQSDAPDATTDPTQGGSQPTDAGEPQPQPPRRSQRALALQSTGEPPDLIAKAKKYSWKTEYHLETPEVN
ncbi:hypothetical protein FRC10_000971 [Ceratobasidium sp. 414]|nr:hypothetical protein FRC10_000971 [Ceratobasidium sp. 414]